MLLKVFAFGLISVSKGDDAERANRAKLWDRDLIIANATWKTFGEGNCKFFFAIMWSISAGSQLTIFREIQQAGSIKSGAKQSTEISL